MIRTYSHILTIPTFEERFRYLKLNGRIGEETFGFDRYFNQRFYRSKEWKDIRNYVITRDQGCDLAVRDREIRGLILVHHMNPISIDDIQNVTDYLLNPDYLISVSRRTHDAIHYSDESILLYNNPIVRVSGDTKLW